MSKKNLSPCPCCSDKTYEHCCGQYISHQQIAPTAEALMRSRYTAYTQANIDYIQATMREKAAENFDAVAALSWAKAVKWKRLKVIRAFPAAEADTAYVEFMAYYIFQGSPQKLAEISKFKRFNERWYYVEGQPSG